MVGYIDQIHRRVVHKVLVAGDAAHIAGHHQMQALVSDGIAVQPVRQCGVDTDLLRIHGTGHGAPAQLRAVDAGSGPQHIRQDLRRQWRRLKRPLRLAQQQRLHQGQAATDMGLG